MGNFDIKQSTYFDIKYFTLWTSKPLQTSCSTHSEYHRVLESL